MTPEEQQKYKIFLRKIRRLKDDFKSIEQHADDPASNMLLLPDLFRRHCAVFYGEMGQYLAAVGYMNESQLIILKETQARVEAFRFRNYDPTLPVDQPGVESFLHQIQQDFHEARIKRMAEHCLICRHPWSFEIIGSATSTRYRFWGDPDDMLALKIMLSNAM